MVTRDDLSPGLRSVQSAHAAVNFVFEHPGRAGPWFKDSNYLILKSVNNLQELEDLIYKCEVNNLAITIFKEPDIGNQITAIAIEPSPLTQKLVRRIPLLFKNNNHDSTKDNGY